MGYKGAIRSLHNSEIKINQTANSTKQQRNKKTTKYSNKLFEHKTM